MSLRIYLIMLLAVLGIFNTAYLIHSETSSADLSCWFISSNSCQTVQNSSFSKTGGIPNSYLGLFFYSSVLILAVLSLEHSQTTKLLKIIISWGFLFSLYFIFIQAFVIKAWCSWCLLSALDSLLLLALIFFGKIKKIIN